MKGKIRQFAISILLLNATLFAATQNIRPNTTVDGSLSKEGEVDLFKIVLNQKAKVEIFTTGSLDTYGYILDSNKRVIVEDDDEGQDTNFKLVATLNAGSYYVKVKGYDKWELGDYTLHFNSDGYANPDKHGDTIATATPFGSKQTIDAALDREGDIDITSFSTQSGGKVYIYTSGSIDTYCYLLDSSGKVIAQDDDSGEGTNCKIDTTIKSGNYYIKVRGYDKWERGAYTLTKKFAQNMDKVYAFYADEHNTQSNPSTGQGSGNRILQIDIENMSLVNELPVPGIAGHHADYVYNSKIYGVPKGSNFINVIKLSKDSNGAVSMRNIKQIQLPFKPRSGDAYNARYNIILLAAANRPMGALIDVQNDEIVGLVGQETDCTLTDGSKLLSHSDANTPAGALKYQCAVVSNVHGGTQISGHPYWLTDDILAIVDRTNKQISTYKINKVGNKFNVALMNRVKTRTSVHQIVPRDRTNLPVDEKMDFYAVEEGEHVGHMNPDNGRGESDADYAIGKPHALIHLKLTTKGLKFIRRLNLQRVKPLSKAKSDRILDACINIYRRTFSEALNGPSQRREDMYNDLFRREGITRNPNEDPYNDFPVDCFFPGIPGGHNADFAPNNRHLYIGMAGGAMSIVDVRRWKIANNIDIGLGSGVGHTCFSAKNNVAITSNHGFSKVFRTPFARSIRFINSERPIGYYWIRLPFSRENISNTAVSHTCYVDESGDNYYNFYTDGGVFYKIDMSGVFNNPTNGSSDLVVDSIYTGGVPIQGSYIHSNAIKRGN